MQKMMIAVLVMAGMSTAVQANEFKQEPLCRVKVCNKIERFSLNIWSHVKDSMGEVCMDVVIPKSQSVVGNKVQDESRWYQGSSINPTKRSVTRVAQVYECQE